MSAVTAVVKVYSKVAVPAADADTTEGETRLSFIAPYTDSEGKRVNEEWAKYTPCITLQMNVLNSVAEHFVTDKTYLLTFTPKED